MLKRYVIIENREITEEVKVRFDNEKYLTIQSEHIKQRIGGFGDKLYLEFGGKLFDDYHASRVLPGFASDNRLHILLQMADQAEVLVAINVTDTEKNKIHRDLDTTYDKDVLCLIQGLRDKGFYVGSIVATQYNGQNGADQFKAKLEHRDIKVCRHYRIKGYPSSVPLIISDEGYGKNDYIETIRLLVIIMAPDPGNGKMAICLLQLYHENKHGIKAGYTKFETFLIWNLPSKHPVNLVYETVTADLNDVNMIDPYHLEAYGMTAVNYNRDVDIFPVLSAIFEGVYGGNPYRPPTDTDVNMAGLYVMGNETCYEVSKQEVIRRYYHVLNRLTEEGGTSDEVYKIDFLMNKAEIDSTMRPVITLCLEHAKISGDLAVAMELNDSTIVTGKTSSLLGASTALLLSATKAPGDTPHNVHLTVPSVIEPIQTLKIKYMGSRGPCLHTDEALITLSISTATDEAAEKVLAQLPELRSCQIHISVMLSDVSIKVFSKLGVQFTSEPVYERKKLYC